MFNKQKDEPGRKPDFSAREGIAVWTNQDKNGKAYLTIDIPLLGIRVNAFSTEQEKKDEVM